MNTIANLDTAALDTAAKFFRVMSKAGADFNGPMQNVAQRRNLVDYLAKGCPRVNDSGDIDHMPTNHDLARMILGDDFITPEDIMAATGLTYSHDQLEQLKVSLPPVEVIAWCKGNNAMLLPSPPEVMSLLDVREQMSKLFLDQDWYNTQHFASVDRTDMTAWLALGKAPVPVSTQKRFDEQQKLVKAPFVIPNAAEVGWGVTIYKAVRDIQLFEGVCVRTSSVDSEGNHVHVGDANTTGLYLSSCFDIIRSSNLGVVWSRKFPATQQS